MWQRDRFRLFNNEIELLLSTLSDTPSLVDLINESLAQYRDELASVNSNTRPWPLLPLAVCEAISQHYEHAIPAIVSLQFLRAAADILDDVEDADSPRSFSFRYGSAIAINVATTLIILAEKAITRLKEKKVEKS